MSVHPTHSNPALYPSLGSKPGGVFSTITPASWGCGVTDSIGGFEPLDPGSTPGTLTGLSLLQGRVNVADIIWVCGTLYLGSNPSTPTKSTQHKMKMNIEKGGNKMTQVIGKINIEKISKKNYAINGVPGFTPVLRDEDAWHYVSQAPICRCIVFPQDDGVEIHNVKVYGPRGQGHGTAMIANIRQAFPEYHIWVNTAECSRGFWEKMVARGHIDSIENEYWWPCWDTTCTTCHPTRATGKRREV